MSFEEAMGNGWAEAIHPADRERVLNEWTSAVALGNLFISELRFLDKKGNPTWLSVKAVPLSDAAKNPIGFIGMASDISKRIKSQEELKKTNEQLSRLTAHLLNVREEERKKIGREIHDELGQQLTAIKMNAAWIDKKTPATDTLVKNKLGIIIDLLDDSNQSVHKILNELKPSILDEHALLEVIQRQCTEFAEHSGVKIYFSSIENELITSDEVSIAVYRVIQESLTNILRHANAKRVFILLKVINEQIHMTIEDDGVGFDSTKEKNKNSFGILGMAERIKALKGNFELFSSPGKGTKLSFIIPLFTETPTPG
jgi:signal transduction histidine kinase